MLILDTAKELFADGCLSVPLNAEYTPAAFYSHWRQKMPTEQEVLGSFKASHTGIAILTGIGGIYAIDVDTKNSSNPNLNEAILSLLRATPIHDKTYIESTKSGGLHIWFKAESSIEEVNIAYEVNPFDESQKKVVVEHHGFGLLCNVHPTPNYLPLHGSIKALQTLTNFEVQMLEDICRSFDERPLPEVRYEQIVSPGSDYAARVDIDEVVDILEGAGWKKLPGSNNRLILLNRPGARNPKGIDATIKVATRTFFGFSSSISDFEPKKGYGFYSIYGLLRHGGDFAAAAKELAQRGYGKSEKEFQKKNSLIVPETKVIQPPKPFAERLNDIRYRGDEKDEYEFLLFASLDTNSNPYASQKVPIAGGEMIVGISGLQKSRKTALLTPIAAAAITGGRAAMWSFGRRANKILWCDTEQGSFYFRRTQRNVLDQAGFDVAPSWYDAVRMRRMSFKERIAFIDDYLAESPETDVVVIDGIIDLVKDQNDVGEGSAILQWLQKIADEGRMVLTVIHLNESGMGKKKMTGFVGTFLARKCDAAFAVSLDNDDDKLCTVKNTEARGPKLNAFDFRVNDRNIPYLEGAPAPKIMLPEQPNTTTSYSRMTEDEVPF